MPVINQSKHVTLANQHTLANTASLRMKGLLGRTSLQDEALIIEPCNSIHMFFMKFAIDVLFLDKDNKVVGLVNNIKPFHLSPIFFKAKKAVELPAGIIQHSQTEKGDQIIIQ